MQRVTTASDVELQVFLLTDKGKCKLANGEELSAEDSLFSPAKDYEFHLKIDKSIDEPFVAKWENVNGTNCYLVEGEFVNSLVITIPSDTFKINGRLMIAVVTNETNYQFEDDYKQTVTEYEKTEVYYVLQ